MNVSDAFKDEKFQLLSDIRVDPCRGCLYWSRDHYSCAMYEDIPKDELPDPCPEKLLLEAESPAPRVRQDDKKQEDPAT